MQLTDDQLASLKKEAHQVYVRLSAAKDPVGMGVATCNYNAELTYINVTTLCIFLYTNDRKYYQDGSF